MKRIPLPAGIMILATLALVVVLLSGTVFADVTALPHRPEPGLR